MDPRAERRQHADAPVARLIEVALDDDRLVGGYFAGDVGLVVQVLHEVRRGPLVEAVLAQPLQRPRPGRLGQLAGELADVHAELERTAGPVAVPEGHLAGLAGRRGHQHLVLGDLLDAPRRGAQHEDVAGPRFEDHLLVEFSDATLLAASDAASFGLRPVRGGAPGLP